MYKRQVCFILPTGRHLTCRGECPGKVAFARLAGDYGFGYDPLFIPCLLYTSPG